MTGYVGQQGLSTIGSQFNVLNFLINQILGTVRTATLVKVIKVYGGGVSQIGFVDVQPLVNQIDGQGNSTPHGTVFHLAYLRIQGGINAVICDPVAGDIGIAMICDRDVSAVKSTQAQANPGSFRRFDLADGIYCGGTLNGPPQQYVEFTETGVTVVDKNGNSLTSSSSGWAMVGNLAVTGDVTATGDITAGKGGADSVTLQNHEHGDVQAGSDQSGPPVAGT